MRSLVLLPFLGLTLLSAQSITRVEYEVLPGNLIEVNYTIFDPEPDGLYAVELYASLDGGYTFPIHARSVTGDVGRGVVNSGLKSILWNVLADVPALVSDHLVLKVVGRTRITVGGFFRSLLAGNRFTKRLSNGVTFYGGGGSSLVLEGGAFESGLAEGRLLPKVNGRIGMRVTAVPFIYQFDFLYRNWDLELKRGEQVRLGYLSYVDPDYGGEEILLHYGGASFSAAYTPLPVFGILLVQVGGGVSINQFRLGNSAGSLTSTLNNPGLFAETGVQVNLLRWLKVNFVARQYFFSPMVDFSDAYASVGLHIPTR